MSWTFPDGRAPRGLETRLIVLACYAVFVASPSVAADAPANVNVDIDKFAFKPKDITVAPGTTVRWTNHDEATHTVTSQDKGKPFASTMDTSDSYEFTFTKEGDFGYVCTMHPFMTGVVHVRKP